MPSSSSNWFNCRQQRPEATCRLICFPWAGGGTQFYARWGVDFSKDIEVVGVRYPGRETRRCEPHIENMTEMVKKIAEEIFQQYSDKPIAFFGHSLGVLVAYEVAVHMKKHYDTEPVHLFLSSSFAPQASHRWSEGEKEDKGPLCKWSDSDLIMRIKDHGGTPSNFTEDIEFMKRLFLPPYRADLRLLEEHQVTFEPGVTTLTCPFTLYDGRRDTCHQLDDFAELTSGCVDTVFFTGRHFYLLKTENSRALRKTISSALLNK